MTATTNLHTAPTERADELLSLAQALYAHLSSGHDGLAYNVDAPSAALTIIGADGKRRPVQTGSLLSSARAWQRAREIKNGVEVDRRLNAWVLAQHLRGKYAVAIASAGWVEWIALDIDAHVRAGESELAARRRAEGVLGQVWRAFSCSAERHPIVFRSPGSGFHVWMPLLRGEGSQNDEVTWPAPIVRAWVERHLVAAGVELAPGTLEVFPSGRCLRAPCGRGMLLLQATRPDDPDALGLQPWPGTVADAERVDWRGERPQLSAPTRRIVATVRACLAQWNAQRRSLADWLRRPEASWDPTWAFLGWRTAPPLRAGEEPSVDGDRSGGASDGTKKSQTSTTRDQFSPSQHIDDVSGGPGGTSLKRAAADRDRMRCAGALRARGSGPGSFESTSLPLASTREISPDLAGDPLVRGRAFRKKVQGLLVSGITEPSTRHDAVLTLAFYWCATSGLSIDETLARLASWCTAHAHTGSRLGARPKGFRATCLREAAHYLEHYAHRWRFRGTGEGASLQTLASADRAVVQAIDARVRPEASVLLAWLADHADASGRVGTPVVVSSHTLARLCGDRRIVDGGQRRRATTLAIAELERLGVLTMAKNYRVGHRGRSWCCWYRFGSGELPQSIEIAEARWNGAGQGASSEGASAAAASSPAIAPTSTLVVRVVGETAVPEGVVRALSDGSRAVARTQLDLAGDVGEPTARAAARPPWFVRAFERQTFTPGELAAVKLATVIAFPDLEARRKARRPSMAMPEDHLGAIVPLRAPTTPPSDVEQGGAPAARGSPDENATSRVAYSAHHASTSTTTPASASRSAPRSAPRSPIDPRDELAGEVGERAQELPFDVAEIAAAAWRTFRRIRDPD
jgi:hypothetical protein